MRIIANLTCGVAIALFGLIAGFFYAFSVDVMPALDQTMPSTAIEAMQAINLTVRNPVFFVTFFLTPVVGFLSAILLYLTTRRTASLFMLGASIVYIAGAFLPTVTINVPMNEALAILSISDPSLELKSIWDDYSKKWTLWNTARTIASTLALILASIALFHANDLNAKA